MLCQDCIYICVVLAQFCEMNKSTVADASTVELVVLDGYTLNPGDLHWKPLELIGDCTVYDRSTPQQVIERIGHREIALTNKAIISRETFEACPNLKYVGVLATGYNVVDIDAAREHGVVVTNAPGYSTAAVAQMVFAHLLNFAQHVGEHAASVSEGRWSQNPDFCYWVSTLVELDGLTMGLVGYGKIAQAVSRIAQAFGMKVLCYKPNRPEQEQQSVTFVDKETLFRESDVVSLHCPLNEATHHLINEETLSFMKRSAILINTGRGDLVDEPALVQALQDKRIAGAGLDVTSCEPIPEDHPFLKLENCYITPHIAWATLKSRTRLLEIVADNLRSFLSGKIVNAVS